MEKYNDFAIITEDKLSEINSAYKNAENKVEILRGENKREETIDGGERFIGSPVESPTSEPINSPSLPINSPSLPEQSPVRSPAKKNSLTQFNLLLFIILLELLYDSNGTNCGGNY